MIEIDGKLISMDIFEKQFVCDLNACKGACCVEGDAGAPLELEEVELLEEVLEEVKPFMRKEGVEAVEKEGVFYMDWDNEPVVTLIDGAECAFVTFDQKGTAKCAIEEAHNTGKTNFKKPISCHLYPIRVSKLSAYDALNYNQWHLCNAACKLGEELKVKTYQFLKEPIVRKWGGDFYREMEAVDRVLEERKKHR